MASRSGIPGGLRMFAVAAFIAIAALPAGFPGLRLPEPVLAASGGCSPSSSTCFLFDVRLGTGPGLGTGFGTYRTKNPIDATYTRIVCHYGNETQTGTCGWGYSVDSPGEGFKVLYSVLPDPGSQACQGDICHGADEVEGSIDIFGNYYDISWHFLLISPFQIDVATSGTGSGTVTSDPPGIDCPDDCTDLFAANLPVTLTARPASGSVFAGWSGDSCTGTSKTCEITTDFLQSVTAKFNKKATPPPATETPTEAPSEEITPEPTVEPTASATPLSTVAATAAPTAVATPEPTAGPAEPAATGGNSAPLVIGLAVLLLVLVAGAVFFARRGAARP